MRYMWYIFYCTSLFIYCDVTDDDTDAYRKIIMYFKDSLQFLNSSLDTVLGNLRSKSLKNLKASAPSNRPKNQGLGVKHGRTLKYRLL